MSDIEQLLLEADNEVLSEILITRQNNAEQFLNSSVPMSIAAAYEALTTLSDAVVMFSFIYAEKGLRNVQ